MAKCLWALNHHDKIGKRKQPKVFHCTTKAGQGGEESYSPLVEMQLLLLLQPTLSHWSRIFSRKPSQAKEWDCPASLP